MFVIAAILAPPDVITQTGLAVPLIALYEISILSRRAGSNPSRSRSEPMHDIRAIRADPAAFDAAHGPARAAAGRRRRSWRWTPNAARAQTALQEKQARRNALAKEIGQGKRAGADTAALEAEATALRGEMEGWRSGAANSMPRSSAIAGSAAQRARRRRCRTGRTKPPTSC